MKDAKAQGGIWGIILAVAGMLIFAVVALSLAGGIATVSTGAVSTAQCKASIELVNNYNNKVDKAKVDECHGWEYLTTFGSNRHCVARFFTASLINPAIDSAKTSANLCIENIEDRCPLLVGRPGTAADAADCLYKRAVTTYYTLQGGRDKPKLENAEGNPFNLYKISVRVDGPGSIILEGRCTDYIDASIVQKKCEGRVGTFNYLCAEDLKTQCNITFSKVNEQTMTLTAISRCQENGPGDPDCRCFANPDAGYSTLNGLPNMAFSTSLPAFADFASENGAIYKPAEEFGSFRGCGWNPIYFKGENVEIGEGKSKAKISKDSIEAGKLDINAGEEAKICYTRLRQFGKDKVAKAVIEGERQDEACQPAPKEESSQ